MEYLHQDVTERVIGAYHEVYGELGRGFLEKVYHKAMSIALRDAGLSATTDARFQVMFRGHLLGDFIPDLIVEDCVLVEIKATSAIQPHDEAQLLNYLGIAHRGRLAPEFWTEARDLEACIHDRPQDMTWSKSSPNVALAPRVACALRLRCLCRQWPVSSCGLWPFVVCVVCGFLLSALSVASSHRLAIKQIVVARRRQAGVADRQRDLRPVAGLVQQAVEQQLARRERVVAGLDGHRPRLVGDAWIEIGRELLQLTAH